MPAIAYCEPRVEIHDLQEFAVLSTHDERHVGVVEVDLGRRMARQPVGGRARRAERCRVFDPRGKPSQQGFQLVDAGHAGQRGVLADQWPRDGAFDEGSLFTRISATARPPPSPSRPG